MSVDRYVHNHGPEDGPGLACRESLIGECLRVEFEARVAELERENAALRESLDVRINESARVTVQRMVVENGSIDMTLRAEILPTLVEMFAVSFEEHGATNYLEIKANHDRLGLLSIRVQRHEGKTPHELREESAVEAARLRALLDSHGISTEQPYRGGRRG